MSDPIDKLRAYLDEVEAVDKEFRVCYRDDSQRLIRLCRVLLDCATQELGFFKTREAIEKEVPSP